MPQYVRHVSGQGEQWELAPHQAMHDWWQIQAALLPIYFPKSEYRLVEPPEVWVDVTEHCIFDKVGALCHAEQYLIGRVLEPVIPPYRLRKVGLYLNGDRSAFIVERREP